MLALVCCTCASLILSATASAAPVETQVETGSAERLGIVPPPATPQVAESLAAPFAAESAAESGATEIACAQPGENANHEPVCLRKYQVPVGYFGGPVQHAPKVFLIFWGSNWTQSAEGAKLRSQLINTYGGLTSEYGYNLTYQHILSQYADWNGPITENGVVIAGDYVYEGAPAPQAVTYHVVEEELEYAIAVNGWPRTPESQFVVLHPPGSDYQESFVKAEEPHQNNEHFCGYHSRDASEDVYGFIPDVSSPIFRTITKCQNFDPAPGKNEGLWQPITTMIASHEYAETVTDPGVGTGVPAWKNDERAEIADICDTAPEAVNPILGIWVSAVWGNHENGCVIKDAPEPTPPLAATEGGGVLASDGWEVTGKVDPEGHQSRTIFEYGTSSVTEQYVNATPTYAEGITAVPESATLPNLAPETTYRYRIRTITADGEAIGAERSFRTPVFAPQARAERYETLWENAEVAGSLDPDGSATSWHFNYGTTPSLGSTTPVERVDGFRYFQGVWAPISGLQPGTTYYYRLVTENQGGRTESNTAHFTTLAQPTASGATEVGEEAATLNGTVDPGGQEVRYEFEYWAPLWEGRSETAWHYSSSTEPIGVSLHVSGLKRNAVYRYRIYAEATAWAVAVAGAEGEFKTGGEQCSGANITGQGSDGQAIAQNIWTAGFNTSIAAKACNGTQGAGGAPTVTYEPTNSGAALRGFGAEHANPEYATSAVGGSSEPPTPQQKAEVESQSLVAVAPSLDTIPVLQTSLAILVHLPVGCTAESTIPAAAGKTAKLGRLVFDSTTLAGIYQGTISTWKQVHEAQQHDELPQELSCKGGSTEEETPIGLIVPSDQAGTTHLLKAYLAEASPAAFAAEPFSEPDGPGEGQPCGLTVPEEAKHWQEIDSGCENQRWPTATNVTRAPEAGETGVVAAVAAIPSSIGYADLAVARANGAFSTKGLGGENKKGGETILGEKHQTFWAEIQNSYETLPGEAYRTYADPSSDGDVTKAANANCASTFYVNRQNGENRFPPKVGESWVAVAAYRWQKHYPLCGLTYDLALREYAAFPETTPGEGTTVRDYLGFVLDAKAGGGQALIKNHDYEKLTANLYNDDERGLKEIGP
jgi:ABC-type phosphate transport system substrate-binding protein